MKNIGHLSDDELVLNTKNGNEIAFNELVNRYYQKMANYVYHSGVQNKENIENIVQNVFLKIWKYLNTFKGGNFSAWVYRICRGEIIDYLKKDNRNGIFQEDRMLLIDKNDKIYDSVNNNQKKEILNSLLKKIRKEYRESIYLYYYEDKTYEEIGEILGLTKGTIGTFISRGKKELQNIINKNTKLKKALNDN